MLRALSQVGVLSQGDSALVVALCINSLVVACHVATVSHVPQDLHYLLTLLCYGTYSHIFSLSSGYSHRRLLLAPPEDWPSTYQAD
jgi:hypothetical protein